MGQNGIYMYDLNLVDSLMKITTIFLNTAKGSITMIHMDLLYHVH